MPLGYGQLELISDAVPALISFVDCECRYRTCNEAYTTWFGIARQEMIGRTMQEVLGDEAWQIVQPHVLAALDGATREFDAEITYPAQGRRHVHVVYTPQFSETSQVTGLVILITDITARREAEDELRKSEERFRAFVTASSDVVYRMSPDWREMWHLTGRNFMATSTGPTDSWLEKYILAEDRPRVVAAFENAVRTKTPFELEHRVIRADGTIGWTHSRAIPLRDPHGNITEWIGAASDVTERHRAEEALRASEERYRFLFESIDEGFCVIEILSDADGRAVDYRFLDVNPAFEKQSGLQNATGKRMLEFVAHIEPHWLENYGGVAKTGQPIRFVAEYRALHRWFEVYAFPLGPHPGSKVAVLFTDATERKLSEQALRESEARFRNMSDHAPMMLWVTDAMGRCTHLNERWLEFTGQTLESGLGFGWLDAVHPDDRAAAKTAFEKANAARQPFRAEYRLRHHDGSYRWAIDAASPRFSESGEYLGYIGSVIDIQARKEVEDALHQSRQRFDIVKDASQVGFWFCDLPFRDLEWDNRVKEHFWLPPEAHVTIDLFYERLHPDDREPTRAAIAKSIAGHTRYDIEYRTVQPDTGEEKWIRAIGRTFYDGAGHPIRFDGV
ncbi:MAG TPA: PAS domain S-box protein, partial [Opitutus sp.]|nr:PAS domain S-box protein [Opitutus sp.]